jgi:predicted dehydrogenase
MSPPVPEQPLTGALVGFGKVAEMAHLPAFQATPGFRLAAVADPLPERRARARELLPDIPVYPDQAALLAGQAPLDFVDLCTPPADHSPLALAALAEGCHVLCEKPLTLNLSELAVLADAAAARGRALVTVHNWKYAPIIATALDWLRAGAVGEVRHLEWEVHRTSGSGGGLTDWRQQGGSNTGGILVDHGWHAFYLLLGLAGAAPQALRARMAPLPEAPRGVEHEAEVDLRFPGARARLFLTWRAAVRRNWGRVAGTTGELVLDDDRLILRRAHQPEAVQRFPEKLSGGSHHPQWTLGALEEFAGEIREPGRRGRNLAEAAACARLIDLAYRSHAAGGAWQDYPSG